MDHFENTSVSGILERTPHQEPFYSEVRGAIDNIRAGDISNLPLFSIIHGHVGALLNAGTLSRDWSISPTQGGAVVAHKDFLDIQDEFSVLERGKENTIRWNAELSLDALRNGLNRMRQFRSRHTAFFRDGLKYLNPGQLKIVNDLTRNHTDLLDDNSNLLVVAMPSHVDNAQLWETFNLQGNILDRIPPWVKICSRGVVLASRGNNRGDDYQGRDFFPMLQ